MNICRGVTLRTCHKLTTFSKVHIRNLSASQAFCAEAKEDMDKLEGNPYLAKYQEKLKKKQESNPDEFQKGIDHVEAEREKERKFREDAIAEEKKRLLEQVEKAKDKKLDDLMKLDLIKDKPTEEITQIWNTYHKSKDCLYAVIPTDEYTEIMSRASEYTTFLYPLPRADGYEFFLQQIRNNTMYFTPLIKYQQHKENSAVCATIHHYTELAESKGIVLMSGEVDTDVISIHEAQLLALQVKMYYGLNAGLKFNLVRLFKNSPDSFRYMDLVKEFENFKKDSKDVREGTWV